VHNQQVGGFYAKPEQKANPKVGLVHQAY
jgi:hypothetical protein